MRVARWAERSCAAAREFYGLVENTDNIRAFGTSDFFAIAADGIRARAARGQKTCRDDALSMSSSLCKKFGLTAAKVDRDRPNRARIERIGQSDSQNRARSTDDRGRKTANGRRMTEDA